ncbi:MAG TPA: PHP domain-containing protein, partial [Luteibaculaceae bacterium]|nr:PHP domain-containing protein [Luteibaculaceae bacterium]
MYLIFDTETTGLPKNFNAPLSDFDNWPRVVQLAWQLHDSEGKLLEVKNYIVKPEGFTIPYNAEQIHGISTERALREGMPLAYVLAEFNLALEKASFSVGHNISFDINVLGSEYLRMEMETHLHDKRVIDTKDETTDWCAIPGGKGGKFKWPTLTELYEKLFGESFAEAHNASADVEATTRAFLESLRKGIISAEKAGLSPVQFKAFQHANPDVVHLIGLQIQPYQPEPAEQPQPSAPAKVSAKSKKELTTAPYAHLHNHTQYSVLQSTTEVKKLVQKAIADKMPAVGLTDSGNMMAAFHFV